MKIFLVFLFVVGLLMSDILAVFSEFYQDEITTRKKRGTSESTSYFFYKQPEYPRDCEEVYDQCEDQSADGVYLIKPEGSPEPFEVYCNNNIDGGGWTVFQRRLDGSVDFYRNWKDYKEGFGFIRGDFWLGNDKISDLTNQKTYELHIDMSYGNGQPYFAKYNLFRISDEGSKYRLVGLGDFDLTSTTNYDALAYTRNFSFTTPDRDNDHEINGDNCARYNGGAWWFNGCAESRLNAFFNAGLDDTKSIRWRNLPGGGYHLKYTEMKIRSVQSS